MSQLSILRNIFTAFFALLLSAAILTGCGRKTEEDSSSKEESAGASEETKQEKWVLKLEENVKVFRSAKADKAASYIAERFPEGKVAFLIEDVFYNDPDSEYRILLDAIRRRLAENGIDCDTVLTIKTSENEIGAGNKSRDPESVFVANLNKALLDVVRDNVDIVVNFVGLPKSVRGVQDVRSLRGASSAGKNNMLLMSDAGLAYVRPSMIESGRVSAIVDYVNSNGPASQFDITKDTAPKDPDEAFDYLYFFLKADTLDAFIADGNEDYFVQK